jgi:hypothetical protein
MDFTQRLANALLAGAIFVGATAYAAFGPMQVTIVNDGKPVSGAKVSLELADLGKAMPPTDTGGNTSVALDFANAGKIEVAVYVADDCRNGETQVALVGPGGKPDSECHKWRKLGIIPWTGSGHVTIDVARGTVAIDNGPSLSSLSQPVLSSSRSVGSDDQSWSVGGGLGYSYFPQFDCGTQQGSSGCDTRKGAGTYYLDLSKKWAPIELDFGFHKSFGTLEANPRSVTQTSGGQPFKIQQEWRLSASYLFVLTPNLTVSPLIGIARLQGQQGSSGTSQTCFDVGNGQISCETVSGPGGRIAEWTTRGFGGVATEVKISDQWSAVMHVIFGDLRDFRAMDSTRYEFDIGARWHF